MNQKNSLYDCYSIPEILKHLLESKQKDWPNFSLRKFAEKLEMSGHTSLSLYFSGKRKMPLKYIPLIRKIFNLNSTDEEYIFNIAGLEKAKSKEEREVYLKKLRPNSAVYEYHNTFFKKVEILEHPVGPTLMEMFYYYEEFKGVDTIIKALTFDCDKEVVLDYIQRLIDFGFVKEIGPEHWTCVGDDSTRYISADIFPEDQRQRVIDILGQNHFNHMSLVKEICRNVADPMTKLAGVTMPIEAKRFEEAKKESMALLMKFIEKFHAKSGTPEAEMYRFDISFAPLTDFSGQRAE